MIPIITHTNEQKNENFQNSQTRNEQNINTDKISNNVKHMQSSIDI